LIQAVELPRRETGDTRLAPALRDLGELERKLHEPARAREHYEEAVKLLRSQGDLLRLAHTVRHLGDVYHDAGEAGLAASCYREALELYRSRNDVPRLDLANAIRSMAVLHEGVGASEEAQAL
jgi:tetratricopeptide (TPR) repeat protein